MRSNTCKRVRAIQRCINSILPQNVMRSLSLEVYETYMAKSAVFKGTIMQVMCIIYNFLVAISKSKRKQVKLMFLFNQQIQCIVIRHILVCVCVYVYVCELSLQKQAVLYFSPPAIVGTCLSFQMFSYLVPKRSHYCYFEFSIPN